MKYLALVCCFAFAPLAHAQDEKGIYMGAGLGTFNYDESGGDLALGVSDDTWAYHLFGGYKFNENFAVELGIGGTGDIEDSFTEVFPGLGPITLDVAATYSIYTVTALGILPFDAFSLFGGAGYYSASLDGTIDAQGFGTIGSVDGHDSGATALFGIQHDFGLDLKSISMRGQYEWYDFGSDVDASGISIIMLFRF